MEYHYHQVYITLVLMYPLKLEMLHSMEVLMIIGSSKLLVI